ncbi:hypothetical protein PJM36_0205 [Salmonella phage vB_SenM_UTK0005]|nr:hypothetical protein PJM36_0205 [Salmonella phage vB_SenM_UTK0005]
MTAQKPTYDELAAALIHLDDAFQDLFGQVCSNTVTNAWGKTRELFRYEQTPRTGEYNYQQSA